MLAIQRQAVGRVDQTKGKTMGRVDQLQGNKWTGLTLMKGKTMGRVDQL